MNPPEKKKTEKPNIILYLLNNLILKQLLLKTLYEVFKYVNLKMMLFFTIIIIIAIINMHNLMLMELTVMMMTMILVYLNQFKLRGILFVFYWLSAFAVTKV
jgi:hypothetical protein